MNELLDKIKSLEGKTVESVEVGETETGEVYSIVMKFSNGDVLDVSPTNYNYGGQHLRVEVD